MRKPVIVAIAATVGVLGTGGALTKVGPWYYGLAKPSWQPPSWLFGPAWTLIGGATAWSAVLGWEASRSRSERGTLIGLFAVNGVLNVAWSLLFFNRRRPDLALAEVVPLWLSVAALLLAMTRLSRGAAWLMAPYLGWVGFAAYLNLAIVRLNPQHAS